jgi:pSer/pThr/pTyr-binding forkhead associated (FHA) protein
VLQSYVNPKRRATIWADAGEEEMYFRRRGPLACNRPAPFNCGCRVVIGGFGRRTLIVLVAQPRGAARGTAAGRCRCFSLAIDAVWRRIRPHRAFQAAGHRRIERGRHMKLSLVVKAAGKQQGKSLPITLSQFVVGRDPQCHLRPASPLISKRHCALLQREGKAYIRDFGSTNGTFVNDQPVKDEVELHDNDVLKIGPLHFQVRLEQAPAVVKAATPKPPTKSVGVKAASTKTPPPPTKAAVTVAKKEAATAAAEGESSGSDDEDIAAMLLALKDDDSALSSGSESVPEGSTQLDMIAPPGAEDPNKPAEKGKDKDKAKTLGNTSSAAKSILEQYMKRPRG